MDIQALEVDEAEFQTIEASPKWKLFNLKEIWEYRELLLFLGMRDIRARYKQTVLGISWAVIQPFMQMVVFSIFFGNLAQIDSAGKPYPIFNYAGLLPWSFFASGLGKASSSLISNSNLIKKVYFPRVIIPISGIVANLPDFLLAYLVMLGLMVYYGVPIDFLAIAASFFFLLIAFLVALGVGLWLSALNALYRDIGLTLPFFIQLWFFITPVLYSSELIGNQWQILYSLNPMAVVVEGFRWLLLRTEAPRIEVVLMAYAISFLLLFTGLIFFKRTERIFSDIV